MRCAFCGGHIHEVMDFGNVALAGAFLKESQFATEKKYPLSLAYCESCYLVQIPQRVDTSTMFREYFYFSSAIWTMKTHFAELAKEIAKRNPKRVVEIGCNDGVLLKPLANLGVKNLVGVDPATNVVATINDPRIEVINEFFGKGVVSGKADVVVANNVFAHVPDINGVIEGVADLLTPGGTFIFEVNRLDSLISELQYDWIYHEHLYYYSLMALQKHLARFGLEVYDCKSIPTHCGSMRCYVGFKGRHNVEKNVAHQLAHEKYLYLDRIESFKSFANSAAVHSAKLQSLIRGQQGVVAGYGACGRSSTLLQYCGLTHKDFAFIIDDAPVKQGYYTPGSHIPIVSRERLKESDFLLLFAWSFLDEITEKCKDYRGEVVIPFPYIYTHQKRRLAA